MSKNQLDTGMLKNIAKGKLGPMETYGEMRKTWTQGRGKMRGKREVPFLRNLLAIYKSSYLGVTSRRISDYTHLRFCEFAEYCAYKMTLFRIKRRIAFLGVTVGATMFGYWAAGWGTNWYTLGYR